MTVSPYYTKVIKPLSIWDFVRKQLFYQHVSHRFSIPPLTTKSSYLIMLTNEKPKDLRYFMVYLAQKLERLRRQT